MSDGESRYPVYDAPSKGNTSVSHTNPPRLRILSLGAGVQSTAILVLVGLAKTLTRVEMSRRISRDVDTETYDRLRGLDCAIFADTGWEPRAVYEHLDRVEKELAAPAGVPIYRESAGNIRTDALDPEKRFATMPLYVKSPTDEEGMIRRQCTSEYKLKPIKARVRELLGYVHPTPVPRGVYVEQWIGISLDEVHRAKDSDVKYARHVFPLLDLRMTRKDCERVLAAYDFGETPKSACVGCPFHGNRAWRELRDNHPGEWADAVEFDRAIRGGSARANAQGQQLRGEAYLHRSRVPLAEAPIEKRGRVEARDDQYDLFDTLADDEMEMTGCSPFACRSDEADVVWVDIDTVGTVPG